MCERFYTEPFLSESDSDWHFGFDTTEPNMVPLLERESFDDLPYLQYSSYDDSDISYSCSPSESSDILDQLDELVSYSLPEPRVLAHSMSSSDLAEFGLRTSSALSRSRYPARRHHASRSSCSFHMPPATAPSQPPSSSHSMGRMGRKDSVTIGRGMAFAATPCMPYEEEEERHQWRMYRAHSKRSATSTSSSGKSYKLKRKVSGQIGKIFKKVFA